MNKFYGNELDQNQSLLESLLGLHNRILSLHDVEDLPQLVLHDLGHDDHFGLNKAVYLVDNPDFDSLKGVAGFFRDECHFHKQNLWENPSLFSVDMTNAEFHQKTRQFRDGSIIRNAKDCVQDSLEKLGLHLGINNPSCCTWSTRHGNQGILLFEGRNDMRESKKGLLSQIITLLSFC